MKLKRLLEEWRSSAARLAGAVFGPPGTGKTSFLRVVHRYIPSIYIAVKDCFPNEETLTLPLAHLWKKIGVVLHYAAEDIKPSIDRLTVELERLGDLDKALQLLDHRVRDWVEVRIAALRRFIVNGSVVIPSCLSDVDDVHLRIAAGLIYAYRPLIPKLILLDDILAYIIEQRRKEAFAALMRPIMAVINRYPDQDDMFSFHPIVITPGGPPHRFTKKGHYTIIWDGEIYHVPLRDVLSL